MFFWREPKQKAAAPIPPHLAFGALGFLARKLVDEIEKDPDLPSRIGQLKYKIDELQKKMDSLHDDMIEYQQAYRYLCKDDDTLYTIKPQKPHILRQLAEWSDEFAEFLKIKPLFSCW